MFGLLEKFENESDRKIVGHGSYGHGSYGYGSYGPDSDGHGSFWVTLLCFALIFSSFILSSSSAFAQNSGQNQVTLTSKAFVIRSEKNAAGEEIDVLKTPNDVVVIPGDRLKFILSYKNETGKIVDGFKATNPMPAVVQFSQATEDWAEVSIDGGNVWGKLENLTVETTDPQSEAIVKRAAGVADVTHVRWVFAQSIGVNESGELSYEGVVK